MVQVSPRVGLGGRTRRSNRRSGYSKVRLGWRKELSWWALCTRHRIRVAHKMQFIVHCTIPQFNNTWQFCWWSLHAWMDVSDVMHVDKHSTWISISSHAIISLRLEVPFMDGLHKHKNAYTNYLAQHWHASTKEHVCATCCCCCCCTLTL